MLSIVLMQDFGWAQLTLIYLVSLGMLIFFIEFQPLDSRYDNNYEIFNEFCVLMLTYTAISFTNFGPDP